MSDRSRVSRPAACCTITAAALAVLLKAAAASAADAPGPAVEAEVTELDEVQITGTRILQNVDFVSSNPVSTFDAADLERLAINNISDALVQVPQNVSQFTPSNTGGGAFYVGSTLANLRGLNPFFGTRTLTLMDSRRVIPTTQGDAVDLNFIPSNLVQRIETVTGGASAAYGSGAISGVVNVILDKRLQGVKMDADHGLTEHGDGANTRIGVAAGSSFMGGRGHVVAGGEYQKLSAIQSCADARDWCARGRGYFDNTTGFFGTDGEDIANPRPPLFPGGPEQPPYASIPGQPHFMVVDGLRENQLSRSGVIVTNSAFGPAASTLQFDAAGTGLATFNVGAEGWRTNYGVVAGGDGDPVGTNVSLLPEMERGTFFSHGELELTDRVTGYAELMHGRVEGVNHQYGSGQNSANTCIRPDNAYLLALPADVQGAIMAADGNAPFTGADNLVCSSFFANPFFGVANAVPGTSIRKNWHGQNLQEVATDTKVTRAVLGATGSLGTDWNWDGYYQYGRAVRDQIGTGYRTNWRYTFATDAVLDGGGNIVCRVTRDGLPAYAAGMVDPVLAEGCEPLNIFGTGNASQAGLDYAFGALTEHNVIRQDVLSGSVSGKLLEGWAGPVSAAFGVEWRKDRLSNDAGDLPTPLRTDFSLQYGDSFAGSTRVMEGFAELEVPLLVGLPAVRRAILNAAVRTSHYRTAGATGGAAGGSNTTDLTTWKLAGNWDVTDAVRLRGSHSRDMRAPNFRELFYSQTVPAGGTFGMVPNPWIITGPGEVGMDPTQLLLSGNTALSPEKARTTTAGIVLQPGGRAQGLQLSADYFRIRITGGLALTLGGFNAVTECFANGDLFMCSLIEFGDPRPGQESNPDAQFTNITSLRTLYTNQHPYSARGMDFAAEYRFPASVLGGLPGRFHLEASATHMLKQVAPVLRAGFVMGQADLAGQTGGDPTYLADIAPAPAWAGNVALSYVNGRFTGTVQTRFVSKGHMDLQNPRRGPDDADYDPTLSYSASDNTTGTYFVSNLTAAWDLDTLHLDRFQIFGSVHNLFDRDPPFSNGGIGGVNAINFDTLGRSYRLGVRVNF